MKLVVIDARMIKSAGIGRYLKNILKDLKKASFRVKLIVNSKDLESESWLKQFDLIFFNAKIYSIKEQVLLPMKIPKCDLFWSVHFNIPIFAIRAKKRLVTIHDVYHLAFLSKLKFLEKIYAKFVISRAVKLSDKIITVSNFSKKEILKYTKAQEGKIDVIHNGIDMDVFSTLLGEKATTCKLPDKYFLFVGSLKPHKNLSGLIEAFSYFEDEDVHLVIVGKAKGLLNSVSISDLLGQNPNIKDRIHIFDSVTTRELRFFYKKAIALVFASFYEGFGFPPLEAMSLSCPAIVSNIASLPEVCGKAALYVDPHDPKSIFQAMKKCVFDKIMRDNYIDLGKKQVRLFNKNHMSKKHIDLIENIL